MPTEKMKFEDLKLNNPREQRLMELILNCFAKYRKREQHTYLGAGMSTSHIVCHVIEDDNVQGGTDALLSVFWPEDLIARRMGGVTYLLEPGVMTKLQSNVRTTLNKLHERGYLEKIGNTDERRWRPVGKLKDVTP